MVLQMITRYEASLEASLYTSHLVKTLDHSDHKVKQNVEPEQELWKGLDSLGQSLLPHLRWRFVLNRSWQIERELNASGFCWKSVVMCLTKVSGICSFYSWFHHHSPTPARIQMQHTINPNDRRRDILSCEISIQKTLPQYDQYRHSFLYSWFRQYIGTCTWQ